MRRSPFPGMDPYLEKHPRWQRFHGWYIRKLAELHMADAERLGCVVDVERSIYAREPSGRFVLVGAPDALSGESDFVVRSDSTHASSGSVALAEPRAVHEIVIDFDERAVYKQDYLVFKENDQFQRVLAVVELLSPANKEGSYAEAYGEKRSRFLFSRTNFMEIDFLRAGENPSRALFPELEPTPYFIFVARKTDLGRHEAGFPLRLQDPLPRIGLPLGGGRPDLALDLAAAFRSAYDIATHPGPIDYAREEVPGPKLSADDEKWARQASGAAK
jgi:hypothetical protein